MIAKIKPVSKIEITILCVKQLIFQTNKTQITIKIGGVTHAFRTDLGSIQLKLTKKYFCAFKRLLEKCH